MSSRPAKILAAAGLLTLIASFQGCAENESMIFIKGVTMVTPPDCAAVPEEGSKLLFRGKLDVSFSEQGLPDNGYTAVLLVGNQLAIRGAKTRSRTETSNVVLQGAEVTLEGRDGSELASFTSPGSGFAPPGAGENAGWGVVAVKLIADSGTVRGSAGDYVIAKVKVFGETLGGTAVSSNVYPFMIEICRGCLIDFPSESLDPATRACIASTTGTAELKGCLMGQDVSVPCTLCAGTNPRCRTAPK